MRREDDLTVPRHRAAPAPIRDLDTIDYELRLVAALRRAARKQGRPLPSIKAADALLDERRELTKRGYEEATAESRHSPGTPLSS